MGSTISGEPIVLSLPAEKSLMLVIRLTAAGVIARAGVGVDRMEEIKLAVEEACGCLMEQQNPPKRLRLSFRVLEGQLRARAEALDAEREMGDIDADTREIMACILGSLVDSAALEVRDGFIAAIDLKAAL